MKLTFYTPSYKNAEGFGGASFGFAGEENEKLTIAREFPEDIRGVSLCGTYDEILADIPEGEWQAAIVLLGNAGGENEFVRALRKKISAPLVGGAGAICPKTGESALITGRGEAAVFLIADERFDVSVKTENVHCDVLGEHKIAFEGRFIETVDGCDALSWYNSRRAELGISDNDFEHLTFADKNGINAHLSVNDGKLFSGRDLAAKMELRYLPKDAAQTRIENFYRADDDAIVFGCAGLKATLSKGISTSALGLFMFGEVCTVENVSDFGNLMLSKLILKRK